MLSYTKRNRCIGEIIQQSKNYILMIYLIKKIIFIIFVLFLFSCINQKRAEESITSPGTIKYIDLEGGFYGIISDNDKNYDPINLDDSFKVDGLRIHFKAKQRTDISSLRMWGQIIELEFIEILSEEQ